MKKKFFTILGCAFLGALFSMNALAQTWTDITDDNVTSEDNLLANPSFETLGSVKDGAKYNIGAPWEWSIGSANIRVEVNSTTNTNVLVWRGSGNSNYISQPLTGLKANTWYEVKMSQVASGNANANFNVGIGTEMGKYDVASTTVKLGTNNNGIKKVLFCLPSNVSTTTTYYFTFANTTSNTASSGSDPVSQLDWMSMVECCGEAISGTYYLYNEESGTFLSRGSNWGTRSITDYYGYPVNITSTQPLSYTIKMYDTAQNIGLGENLYTDNGSPVQWTFEGDNANGYKIKNAQIGYLTVNGNHADTKTVADVAEASTWKLVTADEHKAIIEGQLDDNKLAVLAAAGIEGTTWDEHISQCAAADCTDKIQSASLTGSNSGWTWTQEPSRKIGSLTTNENGSEIYQGIGNLTQTVTGLDKGIYMVTIQGFYRDGSNADCIKYKNGGWQMSNMYFKGNDFETRIKGWAEDCKGDTNPNSMSEYKVLANEGRYVNTFYTYVGEDGQLSLNLGLPSYPAADNGFWAIFSNVTLTLYIDKVSESDAAQLLASVPTGNMYSNIKAALDNAKAAFEANKTIANYKVLAAAIAEAKTSVADYANLKAAIEAVTYKVIDPGYDTLEEAIKNAQKIYDEGSADNCTVIIDGLDAAVKTAKEADYGYVTKNFSYGVGLGDWTAEGPTGKKNEQHWNGKNDDTSWYLEQSGEAWGKNAWSIKYSQDVTLPAGDYVFKVAGRKASGNGCTLQLVVTNKATNEALGSVNDFPEGGEGLGITTSGVTSFSSTDTFANGGKGYGFEWRYVKFTLVESTTINVAVSAEAWEVQQWVSFCNATVQTNNEANIAMIAYNIALNDANLALADEQYKHVTGSEKTTLATAVAADMTGKSKAEIEAATAALQDATAAFKAAAPAYDEYAAVLSMADVDLPYASAQTKADFATAKAVTPTTAAECPTAAANLLSALRAYYESNALAEGYDGAKDVTEWIQNPLFADVLNYWTSSQSGGNLGALSSESPTFSDGSTPAYYDYYNSDSNTQHGSQVITNMVPGKYLLTITARADANLNNVFVKIGDQQVAIQKVGATGGVYGRGWNDYSVEYTNAKMQDVTIEVYSTNEGGKKGGWFGFTNVRLVQLQAGAQMSINATAQYGTFIAPFNVEIPAGVEAYTCSSVYGSALELDGLIKTIPANKPVIVYCKEGFEQTFYGKSTATEDSYASGMLTGVYSATKAPVGSYVLMLSDDKAVFGAVVADHQPTVGANRCYLTLPEGSSSNVYTISRGTTHVDNALIDTEDAVIYDITGRRVEKATKGIYIINGKKVFVK